MLTFPTVTLKKKTIHHLDRESKHQHRTSTVISINLLMLLIFWKITSLSSDLPGRISIENNPVNCGRSVGFDFLAIPFSLFKLLLIQICRHGDSECCILYSYFKQNHSNLRCSHTRSLCQNTPLLPLNC